MLTTQINIFWFGSNSLLSCLSLCPFNFSFFLVWSSFSKSHQSAQRRLAITNLAIWLDMPERNAQDTEFHFSFGLPLPLQDVKNRNFILCSKSDYIIHFVKTPCTERGHPCGISESQHLYTMLNPVMIVCKNPLSFRPSAQTSLTCAVGVWSTNTWHSQWDGRLILHSFNVTRTSV